MKNNRKESLIKTISTKWWLMDDKNAISYKLVKNIIDKCSRLPKPAKIIIFSLIEHVIIWSTRFLFVLGHVSLKGFLISGNEKTSGKPLKLLFIGTQNPSHFIINLIYTENANIKKEFNINIYNQKKTFKSLKDDIDAVIIKCDRFYSGYLEKKGYKIIPEWVRMTLDISKPLKDFFSDLPRSAKEDIRKIKNLGYDYEISNDEDELEFFYKKMYVPYVSWRYKDTDILTNFYTIKILFEQGSKILFVKYKNDYIFGGLFNKKKNMVTATYAGIKEGEFDHLKKGVIAASYYYLINHSKNEGAKYIDLGSCRSFVNDGLFLYKLKWGAKIGKSGHESSEIFAFKECKKNRAIESFLNNNPFVYLEKGKLIIDAIENKNN
jgi:hypothetical protein